MADTYLLAFVNFVLCAGIVVIAFCRLNAMHGNVLRRVVNEYACYLAGGLAGALQPWWGEWPGWGSIALSGSLLVGLACSSYVWRYGVPRSASKDPA